MTRTCPRCQCHSLEFSDRRHEAWCLYPTCGYRQHCESFEHFQRQYPEYLSPTETTPTPDTPQALVHVYGQREAHDDVTLAVNPAGLHALRQLLHAPHQVVVETADGQPFTLSLHVIDDPAVFQALAHPYSDVPEPRTTAVFPPFRKPELAWHTDIDPVSTTGTSDEPQE